MTEQIERHPHARTLADFFARKLNLDGSRLEPLLSDLLTVQDNGHVCLTLDPARRLWLEKLTGLYQPKGEAPLVLEEDRLYFQRLWQYEETLALSLLQRVHFPPDNVDPDKLAHLSQAAGLDPSQEEAVRQAVSSRFFIITGGPGTGKTTTVIQLLAWLLWQQPQLKLALAAPTGKAAQRLQETINERAPSLPIPDTVKDAIPAEAGTLHRLLGARPDTTRLRHDHERPLPYDGVFVDEASMVDLPMMSKLVRALPSHARLYLLGDRDQLASVEAGSVLADLCDSLPAHTHCLSHTHRFQAGLQDLARALQQGDADRVKCQLRQQGRWLEQERDLWQCLDRHHAAYWKAVHDGAGLDELLSAFAGFQVLCAHRRGPLGAQWLNDQMEKRWRQSGWIRGGRFYPGRAVLIGENLPDLNLFNGDIGLCLTNGQVGFGDGRFLAPARLPQHETVFAMTCHKSQGSEFAQVLVVLPPRPSEVLTRELLYTAITRAKEGVQLWGSGAVLDHALGRTIQRSGGLRGKLQSEGG